MGKKIYCILIILTMLFPVACSQSIQNRLEFFRHISPKDQPHGPDTVIRMDMYAPESCNWHAVLAEKEEGDYQKALKNLNEAIKLDPQYATAYGNRGIVYSKLGEYEKAIEDYDKAIELYPNFANAYFNRGSTYVKLENYQQALEDYGRAIALNPEDPYTYVMRGFVYSHLGNIENECADHKSACKYGRCTGLNVARQNGRCQ